MLREPAPDTIARLIAVISATGPSILLLSVDFVGFISSFPLRLASTFDIIHAMTGFPS